MIDVIDALLNLAAVEGFAIDRSASAPFEPQSNTIYGWEENSTTRSIGTGEVQEDFEVIILIVVGNLNEEAALTRERSVSEALDDRRRMILDTLRLADGRPANPWDAITRVGASADFLRQFEVRGLALRVIGYRLVT